MKNLFRYTTLTVFTLYVICCSAIYAGKILKYDIKKPASLSNKSVLFFMHGYGGSKKSYRKIVHEFGDDFSVVILQAPYKMGFFSKKFSWYDWKIVDGDTTSNQEQINFSSKSVIKTINYILKKENLDNKNVFIGGQSQGAIMACKMASEYPESLRGFIIHNGRLPVVFSPADSDKFSKLNGLVINGKYDKKMLPKYAKSIVNKFQKLGVEMDSISPEIGHGMPPESRSTIKEWINSVLSEQSK